MLPEPDTSNKLFLNQPFRTFQDTQWRTVACLFVIFTGATRAYNLPVDRQKTILGIIVNVGHGML
ncbi:MAG: hypothetical protein AYP45_00510 [Candidatus Brocadia carolinensis]|uniref:Uncharacterized protein n=1 Tax=Candidatus Brocadia carolinensis TaxID=1004156 RepID=A0A1V4AXT8_9BACT|nr:MAG: hypothetical protein AYP45_00510 [Candidatus Brocadia caroliniensis]